MFTSQMRFTGLSGIDTDLIVRQLMQAESFRFNRVQQQRQLNVWRRDAFHGVAQSLITFRDSFLSMTARNSLRAPSTFNVFKSNITLNGDASSAISIRSTDNVNRSGTIRVESVASADKRQSDMGKLSGTFRSNRRIEYTELQAAGDLSFTVTLDGGAMRTITIDSSVVAGINNDAQLQTVLRDAIAAENFGTTIVGGLPVERLTVDVTGNMVTFKSAVGVNASIGGADLRHLGFTVSRSSEISGTFGFVNTEMMDGLNGDDLTFTVRRNNITHNITVANSDLVGKSQTEIVELINTQLRNAFGGPAASPNVAVRVQTNGRLAISTTTDRDFTISGEHLRLIGFNVPTKTEIFEANHDITDFSDFHLPGAELKLTFKQGNSEVDIELDDTVLSGINDIEDLMLALQDALIATPAKDWGLTFGFENDKILIRSISNITTTIEGQLDKIGFDDLTLTNTVDFRITNDAPARQGSTSVNLNSALHDLLDDVGFGTGGVFNINGRDINWSSYMTMNSFLDAINAVDGVTMSFDAFTRTFTLESTRMGADHSVDLKAVSATGAFDVFDALGIATGEAGSAPGLGGTDAVIFLNTGNGEVQIRRTTNSFEANGMAITLTSDAKAGDVFNFTMQTDSEPLMDIFRNFVDEYNKLMTTLNDAHTTARSKSSRYTFYEPLTDEQKRGMSDKEIERWEEEAMKGMLHRDPVIREIHSMMRRWMGESITLSDGTRISLASIGIRGTSTSHRDGGMLEIDENKLRSFIETNGDKVLEIFTKASNEPFRGNRNVRLSTSGISERLNDIIGWAVSVTDRSNISIFSQAGLPGIINNDASINRRIRDQDARLESMRLQLVKKENHFFAMFARMEQALTQSNNQMNALLSMSGMMGGMGGF